MLLIGTTGGYLDAKALGRSFQIALLELSSLGNRVAPYGPATLAIRHKICFVDPINTDGYP